MHCFSILQIEGVEYDHLKSENAKTWLHFSNSLGNKTSMKNHVKYPVPKSEKPKRHFEQ